MSECSAWQVNRTEAIARGGMVAAKTETAAAVGVATLRGGGNAVDAAVATAFAAGVAEPWMNGIGGGGFMVVAIPGGETTTIEYPMIAPAAAKPEMFPLAGSGVDAGLFGWPAVAEGANIIGHQAVAVPGTVAGLALALERYGTMTLSDVLTPAIALAREGVPVTWHTTLMIARELGNLRRFPATAAIFLDAAGNPPATIEQSRPALLHQADLGRTLEMIAREGPRVFYEGAIAQDLVVHLNDHGATVQTSDFAHYEAKAVPALTTHYGGHEVATIGGGTGGTTLVEMLNLLAALDLQSFDHNAPERLHLITQAMRHAFADRFAYLADPGRIEVPLAILADPDYARERAAEFADGNLGAVRAGDPARLGVRHGLAASMPEYVRAPNQMANGSTTHLGVIDSRGMAVSLTQTLLSGWGSRVVVPGTGILLNNGMMWFDPEPGRPNSVEGGKRPLSNMAPAIISRDGVVVASIGSSGGRRIMGCNAQLALNLIDHQMSMQPAISAPRIDASTPELLISARLPPTTAAALAARGHQIGVRDEGLFTGDFASPAGILVGGDGLLHGGADPYYMPAAAIGVEPTSEDESVSPPRRRTMA